MKNFLKASRVLLTKNWFFLLLALAMTLLIQGSVLEAQLLTLDSKIINSAMDLKSIEEGGRPLTPGLGWAYSPDQRKREEMAPELEPAYREVLKDRGQTYDRAFLRDLSERARRVQAQLGLGGDEIQLEMTEEGKVDYISINETPPDRALSPEEEENYRMSINTLADYLELEADNFHGYENQEAGPSYRASWVLKRVDVSLLVFLLILAILFSSAERMTPFYEFTRTLPLSPLAYYGSKLALGGLLALAAWGLSMVTKYLVLSRSAFCQVLDLGPPGLDYLAQGLFVLGFFALVLALGEASGNILGHLGLVVIGLGGTDLYYGNILVIDAIFDRNLGWAQGLIHWYDVTLPEGLILAPYRWVLTQTQGTNLRLALLGLVLALLGAIWVKRRKEERAGLLVMVPGLSSYAFFLAVWTTGSIFSILLFYLVVWPIQSGPAQVLGMVLGMVVSWLFYKKFFKIHIGF